MSQFRWVHNANGSHNQEIMVYKTKKKIHSFAWKCILERQHAAEQGPKTDIFSTSRLFPYPWIVNDDSLAYLLKTSHAVWASAWFGFRLETFCGGLRTHVTNVFLEAKKRESRPFIQADTLLSKHSSNSGVFLLCKTLLQPLRSSQHRITVQPGCCDWISALTQKYQRS